MTKKQKIILNVNNIVKKFRNKKVLDEISFSIHEGEIVTIIGPNGGGKSTLAKIISGVVKQDSGTISFGKNINIGYMPQKLSINSSLPLDVEYFLRLQINTKVSDDELYTIVKQVGIQNILKNSMHEVSGGENQRIMLARALLGKPNLLILDEPEQNVDVNGQAEIYSLLNELNKKQNIAILLISHDLHFVMRSSHHVICLNHHICCEGMPNKLRLDKRYIDLFGSEFADNLAIYPHHHDHKHDILEK